MSMLKTHVALNATDITKSVTFYRAMFGVEPVKYKSDYAKFDIANPPLNLTLNQASSVDANGGLSHLGIQVDSTQEVEAAINRLNEAGLDLFTEENTDCCYALQDKVWVSDPDNNKWEVFVVKVADTVPEKNIEVAQNEDCCTPTCCS